MRRSSAALIATYGSTLTASHFWQTPGMPAQPNVTKKAGSWFGPDFSLHPSRVRRCLCNRGSRATAGAELRLFALHTFAGYTRSNVGAAGGTTAAKRCIRQGQRQDSNPAFTSAFAFDLDLAFLRESPDTAERDLGAGRTQATRSGSSGMDAARALSECGYPTKSGPTRSRALLVTLSAFQK